MEIIMKNRLLANTIYRNIVTLPSGKTIIFNADILESKCCNFEQFVMGKCHIIGL